MSVVSTYRLTPRVTAFLEAPHRLLIGGNWIETAGIWTTDISKAHSLAAKLRAGTVWVNCYGVNDPAMPFGGFKQSGWGREMGHEGLELYTETKAVVVAL